MLRNFDVPVGINLWNADAYGNGEESGFRWTAYEDDPEQGFLTHDILASGPVPPSLIGKWGRDDDWVEGREVGDFLADLEIALAFKVGDRVRLEGAGWRTTGNPGIPMEGEVVTISAVTSASGGNFKHNHPMPWHVWPAPDYFGGVLVSPDTELSHRETAEES